MTDIYERIANVQQHVGSVVRTTEGYGYKYATLADVWNLVKDQMAENHLVWTANTTPHLHDNDGMTTIINEFQVCVFCTDDASQSVHTSYMFEASGAQTVGSYETYYRRYALLGLLGLTTVADDDGVQAVPTPTIQEFN